MKEENPNETKEERAEFPTDFLTLENPVGTFTAGEIKPTHPAEPDLFVRHKGISAHNQEVFKDKKIWLIGGGGLNSWASLGLARSGAKFLTITDYDRVDRTNLSRQFFFEKDLGEIKGLRLAENLKAQAVGGAELTGIGLSFEEALEEHSVEADVLVVGVDNNACRLEAVKDAKKRKIPAVFTMLSRDGMRCQTFLQGAESDDACLWCALPNLDPKKVMPCASAIISSCFMASAFTIFFVHRALMGWDKIKPFNWREADLTGMGLNRTGNIQKRIDCPVCKGF